MKPEELEDSENLEIKVQELEEKISELEERLEDRTLECDDFKGMLGVVPVFKDLGLFDCDNISRMVIQYFKDNGIRYEDYT